MAIDLKALAQAFSGDPEKKVSVSKKWLREVHKELSDLEHRRRYDRILSKESERNNRAVEKFMKDTDQDLDRIFKRQDGLFNKIFGKGKSSRYDFDD